MLEIKSSRHFQISVDDLRQLDDWVFDLSGEEKTRKKGLGGGIDVLAMATQGMLSESKRHPDPHKGVLIFNGTLGMPFEERISSKLHSNQIELVEKRNFCIISIQDLLKLFEKPEEVWSILHETAGEYK